MSSSRSTPSIRTGRVHASIAHVAAQYAGEQERLKRAEELEAKALEWEEFARGMRGQRSWREPDPALDASESARALRAMAKELRNAASD